MRGRVQVNSVELCPCTSGKLYGKCCLKRKIIFTVDKKGRIYREQKLPPEAMEIFREKLDEFKEVFGRKPRGNDPMFLFRYTLSSDDFNHDMDTALEEFQKEHPIAPELIYASKKTKRIITTRNKNQIPQVELDEWQEAVEEFLSGNIDFEDFPVELENLIKHLYYSICHLGNFLENLPKNRKLDTVDFVKYYICARVLEAIRFIYKVVDIKVTDSIMPTVRFIYESYLRLSYIGVNADYYHSFFASEGVAAGIYKYDIKSNGQVNYRTLVDIKSGVKYKNDYTNYDMVSALNCDADVDLYENLYPVLSSYVHPSLESGIGYFDRSEGFLIHKESDPAGLLLIANCVVVLFINEMSKITHSKKHKIKDILYLKNLMQKNILKIYSISSGPIGIAPYPQLLRKIDSL